MKPRISYADPASAVMAVAHSGMPERHKRVAMKSIDSIAHAAPGLTLNQSVALAGGGLKGSLKRVAEATAARVFAAKLAAKSKGRAEEQDEDEEETEDEDYEGDDDDDQDDDGDDDPDEESTEDEDDEPKKAKKASPPVKKKSKAKSSTKAITDPYLAAVLGTTKPAKVYSAHAKALRKANGGGNPSQHASSIERYEHASHLPITTLGTVAAAEERLINARLFHKAER
jgi:hypothetical protein